MASKNFQIFDAHTHFFSHSWLGQFYQLAKDRFGSIEELAQELGWEPPPQDPRKLGKRWVAEQDKYGVHKQVLFASKLNDAELLAAAVDRLDERGLPTLVVWGPGEENDAREALSAIESAAILAPPTSLPVLAALIERAAVFVSGDTGPMHLACALKCPVLAFYGPTDPRVNTPWNSPFGAIYPPDRLYTGIKKIDRQRGFDGLTTDHVRHAVDKLIDACTDV